MVLDVRSVGQLVRVILQILLCQLHTSQEQAMAYSYPKVEFISPCYYDDFPVAEQGDRVGRRLMWYSEERFRRQYKKDKSLQELFESIHHNDEFQPPTTPLGKSQWFFVEGSLVNRITFCVRQRQDINRLEEDGFIPPNKDGSKVVDLCNEEIMKTLEVIEPFAKYSNSLKVLKKAAESLLFGHGYEDIFPCFTFLDSYEEIMHDLAKRNITVQTKNTSGTG